MNNFLFGNDTLQYYETLAGGAGAGDGFNGANSVHTHMTNSRLTDPEILENQFPIFINEFSIRHHSGGQGRWHGGEGLMREVTFLEPMQISLLTSHRTVAPLGIHGGGAAAVGENWLVDQNNQHKPLPSAITLQIASGEKLIMKTPGGGGYGESSA